MNVFWHFKCRLRFDSHGGLLIRSKLMSNFRKKSFLTALSISFVLHLFVFVFTKTRSTDTFVGRVQKIDIIEKGLFPQGKIKFKDLNQNKEKVVLLVKNEVKKFKVGKNYQVKVQGNWLLSKI